MFYKEVSLIKRLVDEIDFETDSVTMIREVYDNGEYYQVHMVNDPQDEDGDSYFLVVDNDGYAIFCSDEYDEVIAQAEVHIHATWILKTLTEAETGATFVPENHTIN